VFYLQTGLDAHVGEKIIVRLFTGI